MIALIMLIWEHGTVAGNRRDAASRALTERNMELARQRSDRSRKGWRTRKQRENGQ